MRTIHVTVPVSSEFLAGWVAREGGAHIIIDGDPSMEELYQDMNVLVKSGDYLSLRERTIHVGSAATHWDNVKWGLVCLLTGHQYNGMSCPIGRGGPFTGPKIEDTPRGRVLFDYIASRRDGDGIPHDRRQVVVAAEEEAP